MITPVARAVVVAALACLLAAPASLAADTKTIQGDGFTITYPPAAEALAIRISESGLLPLRLDKPGAKSLPPAGVRAQDAQRLAALMGYDTPPKAMTKLDDGISKIDGALAQLRLVVVGVDIHERDALIKRLRAGEVIPSLTYDPETDTGEVDLSMDLTAGAEEPTAFRWPIVERAEAFEKPDALYTEFAQALRQLRDWHGRLNGMLTQFTNLHEMAEIAIVDTPLRSTDRRWFADGMANALALLVVRERAGSGDLRAMLPQFFPPPPNFREIVAELDLEAWLAAEAEDEPVADKRAHYYLATLVVLEMIDDHGESFIADLFTRLRSNGKDNNTMQDVYEVFRDLTGTDMRSYIRRARERVLSDATAVQ